MLDPDAAGTPRRAPLAVIRGVLTGAARAPVLVAEAACRQHAASAREQAELARAEGLPPERAAAQVIRAHVTLSRLEGAAAGVAVTTVELTSLWGSAGTLTIPAAVTGAAADLASLAWIQARMVVHLAALYGRDFDDHAARSAELLDLWRVDLSPSEWAGSGVTHAVRRLRDLAAAVGVRFGGRGVRRLLPLVNVPLNARSNARATAALGRRAMTSFAG